jgi:hypothetical protein
VITAVEPVTDNERASPIAIEAVGLELTPSKLENTSRVLAPPPPPLSAAGAQFVPSYFKTSPLDGGVLSTKIPPDNVMLDTNVADDETVRKFVRNAPKERAGKKASKNNSFFMVLSL